MKKISIFLILFLLSLFSLGSLVISADEDDDTFAGAKYVVNEVLEHNELAYGVVHQKVKGQTSTSYSSYDVDGLGGITGNVVPGVLYDQQVNVMEVPSSENVKITSWANLAGHKWTLTSVRALINDYEAKHPGWKVIGAINGDFFDINANGNLPYQTSGAVVSGGEHYKTTSGGTVGFRNDGSVDSLIGNKAVTRKDKMTLAIYNEDGEIIKEFSVDKINETPGANESAVYYAVYGEDKKIIPVAVEENGYFVDKAELALPNRERDFYGKGTISSLEAKTISTGQFAIVSNNDDLNDYLDLDVRIRVQFEYTGAYAGVNDITGGGSTIIQNGEDSGQGLEDRAPRTVIGKKADGTIIMMVIDGRYSPGGMYGADRTELGAIMNYYGAVEAYNLDGGGSSTMIILQNGKFEVMNRPSDGSERNDANALLVVARDPDFTFSSTETINSIKVNMNLVNNNGHDIKELYFKLNDEVKIVDGSEILFEDLKSNTEYFYEISYKNTNGDIVKIISSSVIKTYKLNPDFKRLLVYESVDGYKFNLEFNDPDKASSYSTAGFIADGVALGYFAGAEKYLSKIHLSDFTVIEITYNVNIGDGVNQKVTLPITEFVFEKETEVYFYNFFELHLELVNKFFK